MRLHSLSTLVLLTLPAVAGSYHFAAIWDGAKVWKDTCISTEADRIKSVGPCPPDATDLSRYTAIPGLESSRRLFVCDEKFKGKRRDILEAARTSARATFFGLSLVPAKSKVFTIWSGTVRCLIL